MRWWSFFKLFRYAFVTDRQLDEAYKRAFPNGMPASRFWEGPKRSRAMVQMANAHISLSEDCPPEPENEDA